MRYFYPRPPRGGRHEYLGAANITVQFLSTPSARRATDPRVLLQRARTISIHALREEGDHVAQPSQLANLLFLSTPSARRATQVKQRTPGRDGFLSTPSARRATKRQCFLRGQRMISIHALREEGDQQVKQRTPGRDGFLSTPSARRATGRLFSWCRCPTISIHALREEGDFPTLGCPLQVL